VHGQQNIKIVLWTTMRLRCTSLSLSEVFQDLPNGSNGHIKSREILQFSCSHFCQSGHLIQLHSSLLRY